MEFTKEHPEKRWIIQAPSYGECSKAVHAVSAALREHLPYVPPVLGEEPDVPCGVVRVAVDPSLEPDRIRIDAENDRVSVSGGSAAACLYAAYDFADGWLSPLLGCRRTSDALLGMKLPPYHVSSRPRILSRGVWTWGHVIYDYRRFFGAMARLKLNRVTIWNDYAPVNGKEVTSFAHELGIEVIWGFSWGWGEEIDLSDPQSLERMRKTVLERTEAHMGLGGDGIYFQLFTETTEEYKDGVLIASEAVRWVNTIASDLLERWPGLRIEFGLHALSVRNRLDVIAGVDPRVTVFWEDCGGFPWWYEVAKTDEATLSFTRDICRLRGGKGFGGVLKGQTNLDWTLFEHQTGPSVLGESADGEMDAKKRLRDTWRRDDQSRWARFGESVLETVALIAEECPDAAVETLTEDNLIENGIPLPLALFAAACWDPDRDFALLLEETMRRGGVRLA